MRANDIVSWGPFIAGSRRRANDNVSRRLFICSFYDHNKFRIIRDHYNVRSSTSYWEQGPSEYCRACWDKKELETIELLLCEWYSVSRKRRHILWEPIISCLEDRSSLDPRIILDFFKGIRWLYLFNFRFLYNATRTNSYCPHQISSTI